MSLGESVLFDSIEFHSHNVVMNANKVVQRNLKDIEDKEFTERVTFEATKKSEQLIRSNGERFHRKHIRLIHTSWTCSYARQGCKATMLSRLVDIEEDGDVTKGIRGHCVNQHTVGCPLFRA